MTNSVDTNFQKLEKLNTQFDIWIDSEEYDSVENSVFVNNIAEQKK